MFGFTIAELFWYGTGGVLALAGVGVVIGVLVRSRRPAWRHCPGCLYDMRATQGMQCPECGREARSERAMLRRGIRKRGLIPGAALLVLGTIVATHGYARQQPQGWWSLMPTVVLVEMVGLGQREAASALHDRFSARSPGVSIGSPTGRGNPAPAPIPDLVPSWYADRALRVARRRIARDYDAPFGPFSGPGPRPSTYMVQDAPGALSDGGRTFTFMVLNHLLMHAEPEAAREALLWIATNGPIDAAWWALRSVHELGYSSSAEVWIGEPLDPRWYDVALRAIPAFEKSRATRKAAAEQWAGSSPPRPVPVDSTLLGVLVRISPADPERIHAVLSGMRDAAGDEAFHRYVDRTAQMDMLISLTGLRINHDIDLVPKFQRMLGVLSDAMHRHPDPYWRVAAYYLLSRSAAEDAIDTLFALKADDPDPRVRAAAADVLFDLQHSFVPSSRVPFMERWAGAPRPVEQAAEPSRTRKGFPMSPPVRIRSAPPSPSPEPEPGPNDAEDRTDQDHDASSTPDPAPAPR